ASTCENFEKRNRHPCRVHITVDVREPSQGHFRSSRWKLRLEREVVERSERDPQRSEDRARSVRSAAKPPLKEQGKFSRRIKVVRSGGRLKHRQRLGDLSGADGHGNRLLQQVEGVAEVAVLDAPLVGVVDDAGGLVGG